MPYEEVQKLVRHGIDDYFKLSLGRPEILNRIGENIIVFDFIRPDVAEQILNGQIEKIVHNLKVNKNIELEILPDVMNVLKAKAISNLDNGGRGIGNIVESIFVNPLSRFMFDNGIFENAKITLKGIQADNMPYQCDCDYINN
jgi:ATP-dependent Clp protease ATP-binding subunit ClpA